MTENIVGATVLISWTHSSATAAGSEAMFTGLKHPLIGADHRPPGWLQRHPQQHSLSSEWQQSTGCAQEWSCEGSPPREGAAARDLRRGIPPRSSPRLANGASYRSSM
mmetsp:Transcript_79550/g.140389  ORF Transcript_79550/g.140389 Transcript_79550/m.140389 type:complete len:108 (-) Transcript_79550:1430-1753(-)